MWQSITFDQAINDTIDHLVNDVIAVWFVFESDKVRVGGIGR